jgi:hypothetical protein
MTTLARAPGLPRSAMSERQAVSGGHAHALLERLHEESERQVPFSQARLLLREAASAIERLEAELTAATAELEKERAARQG